MKRLLLLIPLVFCLIGNSQDISKFQIQIDSLNDVKKDLQNRIIIIDNKISELEKEKTVFKFKNNEGIDIVINQKLQIKVRDKDNSSGNVIAEPKTGEKLHLIDFIKESRYWVISSNGTIGYVNEVFIQSTPTLDEFKNNLIIKKEQFETHEAQQAAADLKERLDKASKESRDQLVIEFGDANAGRIIRHDYWVGMTSRMARASLGYPDKINTTTGSWGTDEQWIYDKRNLYLYFENDVLTSYQSEQ